MFFGLTSSLATFQAIMNNLLKNIIQTRDVVTFIDDVMVRTETEEGHDKIMEEVLGRMEKNNLVVKLEKYMYTSLKTTNSTLSKLIDKVSHRNHKRT